MDFWLLYPCMLLFWNVVTYVQPTSPLINAMNYISLVWHFKEWRQEAKTWGHRHSRAKGTELNEHQGNGKLWGCSLEPGLDMEGEPDPAVTVDLQFKKDPNEANKDISLANSWNGFYSICVKAASHGHNILFDYQLCSVQFWFWYCFYCLEIVLIDF